MLASFLARPDAGRGASGSPKWHVFWPVQKPPVFYEPSAAAIGQDGKVYVADSSSGTIQILSPTGKFLAEWGSPGQFTRPTGVAIDRDGALYVADAGKSRLAKLSTSGNIVWSLHLPRTPSGDYHRNSTRVLAGPSGKIFVIRSERGRVSLRQVSSSGRTLAASSLRLTQWEAPSCGYGSAICGEHVVLYVTDAGLDQRGHISLLLRGSQGLGKGGGVDYFFLYTLSGGKVLRKRSVGQFGSDSSATAPGGVRYPTALVPTQNGDTVLAGWGGIAQLSRTGRVISRRKFAECGVTYKDPSALARDPQGRIYLLDRLNRNITTLSPQLRPLAMWGGCLHRNLYPSYLVTDLAGNIYVTDQSGVKKLAPDGHTLAVWRMSAGALSVDTNGEIYILGAGVVNVLSPAGSLIRSWPIPRPRIQAGGIAVDGHGHVYVSNSFTGSILVFTTDGHLLAEWKKFTASNGTFIRLTDAGGLALDADGNLYVAAPFDGVVVKLSPSGRLVAAWSIPYPPDPEESTYPVAVAVDKERNIYAVDDVGTVKLGNSEPQLHRGPVPTGHILARWGPGPAPGQFDNPRGIAIDSAGNVYVADTGNHRIQKLGVR